MVRTNVYNIFIYNKWICAAQIQIFFGCNNTMHNVFLDNNSVCVGVWKQLLVFLGVVSRFLQARPEGQMCALWPRDRKQTHAARNRTVIDHSVCASRTNKWQFHRRPHSFYIRFFRLDTNNKLRVCWEKERVIKLMQLIIVSRHLQ